MGTLRPDGQSIRCRMVAASRHDRPHALHRALCRQDSRMNANWFAAHVDLLLYIYGGIAIALVVWTLWRARQRKRAGAQRRAAANRSSD